MTDSDKVFSGSIAAIYDRVLGPLLFEPYARDMGQRAATLAPGRVLETAAGTGIVTRQLAATLAKDARIVASDLNQAMLDVAASKLAAPNIVWRQCNAMELPFGSGEFDAVICQFGVMFFPDRRVAYREALRVLRPGGTFLFNAWDSLETNELPRVVTEAVAAAFPDDPPNFFARTPHGYHDVEVIAADLKAAGYTRIAIDKVQQRSRAPSAREAATGFCQGTPLRSEIEARDAGRLVAVTEAAAQAAAARFGSGSIDVPMQAIVVSATAT